MTLEPSLRSEEELYPHLGPPAKSVCHFWERVHTVGAVSARTGVPSRPQEFNVCAVPFMFLHVQAWWDLANHLPGWFPGSSVGKTYPLSSFGGNALAAHVQADGDYTVTCPTLELVGVSEAVAEVEIT